MTAQPMWYWAHFKRGGKSLQRSHYSKSKKSKTKGKHMSRTYKAVQVTKPGKLEVVERAIVEPAFGQVRIRVEACGVCHTDALTVEGGFPGLSFPLEVQLDPAAGAGFEQEGTERTEILSSASI